MPISVLDSGGGGTVEKREISEVSRRFQLVIDGDAYEPFLCQEIEVESNGEMDETGTQCGRRKQRQTAEEPFAVTANGLIGKNMPSGYLEPRHLLFDITEGDEVRIVSDFPINEPMEVSNVLLRQVADTPTITVRDDTYIAFEWQIQLGGQSS